MKKRNKKTQSSLEEKVSAFNEKVDRFQLKAEGYMNGARFDQFIRSDRWIRNLTSQELEGIKSFLEEQKHQAEADNDIMKTMIVWRLSDLISSLLFVNGSTYNYYDN